MLVRQRRLLNKHLQETNQKTFGGEMKKVLGLLFLSLLIFQVPAFSQDEPDEEFFEDEEAIVDPADEFVPPVGPGDVNSPRPRPSPRPSGGFQNNQPAPSYTDSNGASSIEFRLVDPPAFKKPKSPTRIPYAIRKKVEDKIKKEDK
jgi:hypothetical protein